MCIIPYGTQQGEISFCAYNTGVGWRQILENMHMTASTSDWYKKVGRHKVYAGGKSVPLPVLGSPAADAHAGCGCHAAPAEEPAKATHPSLVQIGALTT